MYKVQRIKIRKAPENEMQKIHKQSQSKRNTFYGEIQEPTTSSIGYNTI